VLGDIIYGPHKQPKLKDEAVPSARLPEQVKTPTECETPRLRRLNNRNRWKTKRTLVAAITTPANERQLVAPTSSNAEIGQQTDELNTECFGHSKCCPHLGERISAVRIAFLPKWLAALSKGGLFKGSERLVSAVKQFEVYFLAYNGTRGIHTCANYLARLADHICTNTTFKDIPMDVIRTYVKCRSIFRMRFLNHCAATDAALRKMHKKMRKITK
jgi:hypothetical protein